MGSKSPTDLRNIKMFDERTSIRRIHFRIILLFESTYVVLHRNAKVTHYRIMHISLKSSNTCLLYIAKWSAFN